LTSFWNLLQIDRSTELDPVLCSREQRASITVCGPKRQVPGEQKNLPMDQSDTSKQLLAAQKRNHRRPSLKRRNNRWKWMAGATAATAAAGVTTAQAGLVTINLTGNFISATGGNHLNADLTGDGQPDLIIANALNSVTIPSSLGPGHTHYIARVNLNGVLARADVFYYFGSGPLQLGSQHKYFSYPSGSLMGSIPVFFKDLHINGGALTKGSLEVTVLGKVGPLGSDAKVQLDSLTFHTPENGSSLALLAMGASGVLAFRRFRSARQRSLA
jgi:hypothetical protein